MIDFGFDKLALIGAVALIVIGPEKLPKVARTIGHLMGKAQRYVADVKAEVNRSIELEELKKMKTQFETAARDMEQSVQREVDAASSEFKGTLREVEGALQPGSASSAHTSGVDLESLAPPSAPLGPPPPTYSHPKKKWRLKRAAVPNWYKQRAGVRTRAQSGAARVARFRPGSGAR